MMTPHSSRADERTDVDGRVERDRATTNGPRPDHWDPARWKGLIAEAARRHQVPGIVAGVLRLDPSADTEERLVVGTGIANLRTGVGTDSATLCQIGSITKLFTATMIMQLRQEGALDLDTRVVDLLPDFALAGDAACDITVEHLLTHTSGIDGDLFTDTGRGDDCVEKYVATLAEANALFRPGAGWSYCNSGFVVAGRLIEVLDDRTWDASLRARITTPLGLRHVFTLPEEVMAHRHQLGHVLAPGTSAFVPAPRTQIMRSMGPAGIITSSVDDLLGFGAAILRGGVSPTGPRLLTPASVELMTSPRVALDGGPASAATHWGLGWMIEDWDGHRVIGHGGTTVGNTAWFQVLPGDGLVFVIFCNGGLSALAAAEIYRAFARTFAEATPPPLPRPSAGPERIDLDDRRLGTYEDAGTTVTLTRTDAGCVEVRTLSRLGLLPDGDAPAVLLHPGASTTFLARANDLSPWTTYSFAEVDGRDVLYAGLRCLPRRTDAEAGRPAEGNQPAEEARP